ncbi:50S ribosomal protein L11 methyltransferase [Oscillospiraceae bacterium HV4-5-C5C]|nr:50S ribosomal protein L11 methyltransferase [Oscillospiraceae bacterium HV4-5-C5C]
MRWLEIEFKTSETAADAVEEALLQDGALGVATENPGEIKALLSQPDSLTFAEPAFLESLPDYVRIRAYFPEDGQGVRFGTRMEGGETLSPTEAYRLYESRENRHLPEGAFEAYLRTRLTDIGQYLDIAPASLSFSYVKEEDWANQWRAYYHPFSPSPRLLVSPSWETAAPAKDQKLIRLDPGSAFGTGTHETTQLCLAAVDEFMPEEAYVLDLGTGSGILSVAAAKLGARRVDACDIDPHAVEVCRENCQLNGVADRVHCFQGELSGIRQRYDFIVSNILADVILPSVPLYAERMNELGLLVLSGIIADRVNEVKTALSQSGFTFHQIKEKNDWYLLVVSK